MKFLFACLCILFVSEISVAGERPVYQWSFRRGVVQADTFKATAGKLPATVIGSLKFGERAPYAISLDGNSKARQHIRVATNLKNLSLPTKEITVEAWVLIEQPAEWGGICGVIQDNGSYERGWLLGYRDNKFTFAISSESKKKLTYLSDSSAYDAGYWYHVVGTYDGEQMALHVDGKLRLKSKQQSGKIAYPPTAPFTIGAYHDENEFYSLNGQIESVAVYNRVLTEIEINKKHLAKKKMSSRKMWRVKRQLLPIGPLICVTIGEVENRLQRCSSH